MMWSTFASAVREPPPAPMVSVRPETPGASGRMWGVWGGLKRWVQRVWSLLGWLFGVMCLVAGLSVLAGTPILQFLSLGILLDASARVARTGRLRDGLLAPRAAARIGSAVLAGLIVLAPLALVGSYARSAALIDPGGAVDRGWRLAAWIVLILTVSHVIGALVRGARPRHFFLPVMNPRRIFRGIRHCGEHYRDLRDRFWSVLVGAPWLHWFRLGFLGFLGGLIWIAPGATLIAAGRQTPILGVLGLIVLASAAPLVPFLQLRYAVEGRFRAMFALGAVRERFRRAPWAFAFGLSALLVGAIPLYLLRIELIPREAAWLPGAVFVLFLGPARLLVGWADHRAETREQRRHWLVRHLGRLAILPVALIYALVVFFAQYTSWVGVASLYEQHAFLLPVPFVKF